MMVRGRHVAMLCMLLGMIFGWGCASSPRMGTYDVNVGLASALTEGESMTTVRVDLVGVSETDKSQWESFSVTDYFGENKEGYRNAAVSKSFLFTAEDRAPKVLEVGDEIWERWKRDRGAMYLVVLADLPGVTSDEQRRLVLPLDKSRWTGDRSTIKLEITPRRINCLSVLKPTK